MKKSVIRSFCAGGLLASAIWGIVFVPNTLVLVVGGLVLCGALIALITFLVVD